MPDRDPHADSVPAADTDDRSDIEQIVESRKDSVEQAGEDVGDEPDTLTAPGLFSGNAGTGGEVKNQDRDAQ